jgi:hypothetical protein
MKQTVFLLPGLGHKFWLLPIILSLFSAGPQAMGASLVVTNYADSGPGTLRDRIGLANSGDSISFFGRGPVVLSSPLVISKNLRLYGSITSDFKISGNNQTRLFNVLSGAFEIYNLTIADGFAAGTNGPVGSNGENVYGGAFFVADGATLKVTQCVLSNNVALGGRGGTESPLGSAGNGGNGFGGAIASLGTLSVVRSTVVSNLALGGLGGPGTPGLAGIGGQGWGGAIFTQRPSELIRSTLFANRAVGGSGGNGPGGGSGGAVYAFGALIVSSCTIVSNSAAGSTFDFGGAISENSGLSVRDCTIVGNQADFGGGVTGGEYFNTIIAGNTAGTGPDGIGSIVSGGINLIQNTNGLSITGFTTYNIIGKDPLLGPLQDNGSKDTEFSPPNMMPLPGSPAIDKGGNYSDSDQRLYSRPYDTGIPNVANGSDIGAVEVWPSSSIMQLKITRDANQVVLSWPSLFEGFVLESTSALDGLSNWTPVATGPVMGPGEQYYVTLPLEQGNRLFRLKK